MRLGTSFEMIDRSNANALLMEIARRREIGEKPLKRLGESRAFPVTRLKPGVNER